MFNASGIYLKPDHGKVQVLQEKTHRKIMWIQDGRGVSGSYTNLSQDQSGIATKL